MRLSRQQSLTRAFEFARVRNEGLSVAGRMLVLSAAPLPHSEHRSQFGIICTKKIGNAVIRNTLRRRIREIIRTHGDCWQYGLAVVCILRWRAAQVDYRTLEHDWLKTARKLNNRLSAQPNPATQS